MHLFYTKTPELSSRRQTQNKELYLEHKNTVRQSTEDIYISRRTNTKDGIHNHTNNLNQKHKADIAQKFSTAVAFAICNQPNLLSMTCASLPLMGTSASSFGGFPMEKLVRGRAPLLLLFTPTSHSRGNWKKSKRLNLISGWEKQRERGKNAKKKSSIGKCLQISSS